MMLVDNRIGSKDLLVPLQNFGVDAELAHLDSGDFAFIGRGRNNEDIYIGIELKETTDLIASLRSGRFQGFQLGRLVSTYDRSWLLAEGLWRCAEDGSLEVFQGGWRAFRLGSRSVMATDLDSWILSQTIRGGVNFWHTPFRRDTIRFLSTLYHWWTSKSLEEHRGHESIYIPGPDRATFLEPSTERKMISCIPKVGWEKSAALETHFGGIRALLAADEKEITKVAGVGKTIAAHVKAVK